MDYKVVVLAVLAIGLSPLPGTAQVVRGRALDAATDSAVGGVSLALVDSAGVVVAAGVSAADGSFRLAVERGDRYRIRGERIGYAPVISAPLWVGARDSLEVMFRLSAEPIGLPPLSVVAERRRSDPRLASWGFYEREADYRGKGRALFLDADDLDESDASRVTELLRDLPGLQLIRSGHRTFVVRRGTAQRVPFYLDGHPMRFGRDTSVDELLALSSVGAVEIYWRWAPAQYGGGAAVVMWTGRHQ